MTELMKINNKIENYTALKKRVRERLVQGQERIEQEKVRTYWEVGNEISNYIRATAKAGNERAYGKQIVIRLSKDLKLSQDILYQTKEFAEKFPNLDGRLNFKNSLTWTHYRTLSDVPNNERRLELEDQAIRLKWNSTQLEEVVKKESLKNRLPVIEISSTGKKKAKLLTPKRGSLNLFQIIEPESIHSNEAGLLIDQGFSFYKKLPQESHFQAGDIVTLDGAARLVKAKDKTAKDLFTYKAFVEKVVDADTLRVNIDLGFENSTRQYLRLRGIDAPEITTKAGKQAFEFVKNELAKVPFIILRSSRSDKYDRYLAEVFYEIAGVEYFLNNRLLEARLASRVD